METSLHSSPSEKEEIEPSSSSFEDDHSKNPFAFDTYLPHITRDPLANYGSQGSSSLSYPTFLTPSFSTQQSTETQTSSHHRAPSINEQFEQVLNGLDQIKKCINALETCMQQLDHKCNTLGVRMQQIEDQTSNEIGTYVEPLDHKYSIIGTYMEQLDCKCDALGASIEQLYHKCNALRICMEQLDHKNKVIGDTFMREFCDFRATNQSTGAVIAQETIRVVDKAMTDWIQKIYNRIDVRVSQYEVLMRCMIQRQQPPCPKCSKIPNEHDRLPYSYRLITRGSLIQPNTELGKRPFYDLQDPDQSAPRKRICIR
ncbi:hypothetical protein K492DRAFT_197341 [Lichtheimia hyalospora FSU 10163]|nr:hypothetical protein K492DRAFT_197341 [Lichtheimia hyalospora FSU 10163]